MTAISLDIHIDTLRMHASHFFQDFVEEEAFSFTLLGDLYIHSIKARVALETYSKHSVLETVISNCGTDDSFFEDNLLAHKLAGCGSISAQQEYLQHKSHSFMIYMSHKMEERIEKLAISAITEGKGTLKCTVDIPGYCADEILDIPEGVMFPIIGYRFAYDLSNHQ